jgi:hypothetical protein
MICQQCGQDHPIDDLELAFRRPDVIAAMDPEEREQTVKEDNDLCAIKWSKYFVRALLPLRVSGRDEPYCIGIWVEVEQPTFSRVLELWSEPGQAGEEPFDARIANSIPILPHTLGLPVKLHLTGPTTRPRAYLGAQEHPLALEQSQGITAHRAHEYSALFSRPAV